MNIQLKVVHIYSDYDNQLKGGEANFSFRDFEANFVHKFLLKS